MKRTFTLALAAAATFAAASPAQAALVSSGLGCTTTQVSPTASACVGWYQGQLLGGSGPMRQDAKDALALLGYNWTPNTLANTVQILSSISGNTIDFTVGTGILSGKTIIGIHRGASTAGGTQSTAFFRWDNLKPTDKITLNIGGLSSSTLYITTFSVVPEPATWLLMIAGVGLVGWQLRRRRQTTKVSYA